MNTLRRVGKKRAKISIDLAISKVNATIRLVVSTRKLVINVLAGLRNIVVGRANTMPHGICNKDVITTIDVLEDIVTLECKNDEEHTMLKVVANWARGYVKENNI